MDYNKKFLWAAVIGASVSLASCSKDDVPPVKDLTIVEEGNAKPAQKAESTQPTAILGSGGSLSQQLAETFTNIVEPTKAKQVIVACADLDTYEDELVAAYQRGILITVVDPVGSRLENWCDAKGMVYAGDPMSIDDSSLVSFNRKAVSISVQKTKTSKTDEILIEEDEVPLVIFTGWLEDILKPNFMGVDYRSKDIKKRFAPQRVSHVFPIDIPVEALKESGWGIPEKLSLHTTAELSCEVYPLHSFADNASFTGDLYAVEAVLTIHNGNLYNGRWQYSQGSKQYESSGFSLSECSLGVSLYEKIAAGLQHSDTHTLAGGPAPLSTESSSALQTGFEWSFDGWLTGGNGLESATPTPIQEGGWTWNNLSDGDKGISVETMTDGGDILWILTEGENAASTTESGDLVFRCSWIWGVPQATDDSTGRYYMNVNLNPVYTWTRTNGSRIDTKQITLSIPSGRFMLIPPSRKEGQRI